MQLSTIMNDRLASPARLGHVQSTMLPISASPERSTFSAVVTEGFAFVTAQQPAVCVYDPPPRHATTPQRHHPADLPGAALT
jgi:hypothetical protein